MAVNKIYVELDALLDTRLEVFRRLDPIAADAWLSGSYRMRYSDEFWKISQVCTQEQVEEAWKNRKVDVLRTSIRTLMPDLLRSTIASIDWGVDVGDPNNRVELSVNVAPYDLEPAEAQRLVETLECIFPMVAVVQLVKIPVWALQPRQVATDFNLAVFYNFMEWFRTFSERMDEFEMGNIPVIAPRIFAKLPETGSEQWKSLEKENIFDFLQGRLWGRVNLSFQPIENFSLIGA